MRAVLCPDKINTAEWLEVMETAHAVGLRSTATIMFGHVDGYRALGAAPAARARLQERTGGFTEFVPLPFVHMEAPIYLKGQSRKGPTFREAVLMHAVARLALDPVIPNIQASWVKMGPDGAALLPRCRLQRPGRRADERVRSRARPAPCTARRSPPPSSRALIRGRGRTPRQRTTLYGSVTPERRQAPSRSRLG